MVKADGCVAIHADGGAYKPLNWMNAPNRLVCEPDLWRVTNDRGERLEIRLAEVISDTAHDMGIDPGLERDGVEAHLQELVAAHPETLADGGEIIYQGASGTLAWNASGDLAQGHVGIWRFTADGQIEDLEAVPYPS